MTASPQQASRQPDSSGASFSLIALPGESPSALIGRTRAELRDLLQAVHPDAPLDAFTGAFYADPSAAWRALPADSRERLTRAGYRISSLTPVESRYGADGACSRRFRLADGRQSEALFVSSASGEPPTILLSALAGCALGCAFCGTARLGFQRLLKASEMLEMALSFGPLTRRRVAFMGQGEPLMNPDHLARALAILTGEAGLAPEATIVSTAGIVPQMARLARLPAPPTLAISLHAPDDALRRRLIPVSRKWPLARLLPALRDYADVTRRPVIVQYMLMAGVNDATDQAAALATLLRDVPCRVELSRYNALPGDAPDAANVFCRPEEAQAMAFEAVLRQNGLAVSMREDWGAAIEAGCGQWTTR